MTDTASTTDLAPLVEAQAAQLGMLQEQYAALELALEDTGWRHMTQFGDMEFSKDGIDRIAELAQVMIIKNPLLKRGVETKVNYVWGQGITIRIEPEELNTVVQAFLDDEKNQVELTSHQARIAKETELEASGNIFLVLFTDQFTGRVRVRSIPLPEVVEIITNPCAST